MEVKITSRSIIAALLFVLLVFERELFRARSHFSSESISTESISSESISSPEQSGKPDFFETDTWPLLQEKICPNGVPNVELGSTLFKLGREELGIDDDFIFPGLEPDHVPRPIQFYDGVYEASIFIDGYDEKNKVTYPSIWKCANNQIHSYLEIVFNRDENGEIIDHGSPIGHWNDTIKWRLNTERKFKTALNDFDVTEPCIFTVVRDPIKRVLSGYNEAEFRLISNDSIMSKASLSMDKPPYMEIPGYSLTDGTEAAEEDLELRFETFVSNLVQDHPSITKQPNAYRHIHPMSKMILPLDRLGLLPSQSNWFMELNKDFSEALPKFLLDKCPRLASLHRPRFTEIDRPDEVFGLPPMPVDGQHESSEDPYGIYKAAKAVLKKGGPTIRALCHIYAPDYACFYSGKNGSPLGARDIPEICRDVYSSDLFLEAILEGLNFAPGN